MERASSTTDERACQLHTAISSSVPQEGLPARPPAARGADRSPCQLPPLALHASRRSRLGNRHACPVLTNARLVRAGAPRAASGGRSTSSLRCPLPGRRRRVCAPAIFWAPPRNKVVAVRREPRACSGDVDALLGCTSPGITATHRVRLTYNRDLGTARIAPPRRCGHAVSRADVVNSRRNPRGGVAARAARRAGSPYCSHPCAACSGRVAAFALGVPHTTTAVHRAGGGRGAPRDGSRRR